MKNKGLIVIDGPDGTGKTTLAEHLCEVYEGEYVHLTYVPEGMWQYQTDALLDAVLKSDDHLVVIDRHWISEQVYAQAYRGGSDMKFGARGMDRVIMKHAGAYIIALDEPGIVEARFNKLKTERKEMYSDGMRQVAEGYYRFMFGAVDLFPPSDYAECFAMSSGFNRRQDTSFYRLHRDSMERFATTAFKSMDAWRSKQYAPALDPFEYNILGHLATAKIIFVGDRSATAPHEGRTWQHCWPFYNDAPSSCVRFLNKALHQLNFDETKAMWVNINEEHGLDHVQALVDAGLVPVCLGREAEKKVRHISGLQMMAYVDHPSYARRFGHDTLRYAKDLHMILKPLGVIA